MSSASGSLPPHPIKHPYAQLIISILLSAASQVWLKMGAGTSESALGFASLQSPWVWLGILATIGSLLTWLNALRSVPLSLAFALAGIIHALVPLASWICLGETISGRRWIGIALVIVGVVVSSKPATVVEEKL